MSVRDDLDGWLSLLGHPKWKELEQFAESQKAVRTVQLINSVSDLREEDKMRGEYLGIGLFMQYPSSMVELLRAELEKTDEPSLD